MIVPSSFSQDVDPVKLVQLAVATLAPQIKTVDENTIKSRLRDIAPDAWWLTAALCEKSGYLSTARSQRYIKTLLRNRREERWSCEDPIGYVRHQLRNALSSASRSDNWTTDHAG